jgi:hypothetical protein
LPEESRKGLLRFSYKNEIETQPQRSLGVTRSMGASGDEDRFFAQDCFEFFHFLFDLPELGGHKRKTRDGFPASCLRGDLLGGTRQENTKAPVQALPLKAPKNYGKGEPVSPGLPKN